MRRTTTMLLLVGLVASAGYMAYVWQMLSRPGTGQHCARLVVARGDTLRPVLSELAAQRVLHHPRLLYAYARLRHQTELRSGTYAVPENQAPLDILAMLREGRVMQESFTLAEGLNRWQVRSLLVAGGWLQAAQFDALCDDAAFLRRMQVPGPSCEGYLFPETYKMVRGLPPATVLATIFARYRQAVQGFATKQGFGPQALGERDFVTLASIVEKETGAPLERPRIACVFYNRLAAQPPWRLETDPTVIYAATLTDPHFGGNLTRAHLRSLEHPYNTYRVHGLPPGPIANPGRAALSAVAAPVACQDFFFVSTNNGQHVFCPDLNCHNRAVQKWQVEYFTHPRKLKRGPAAPAP